MDIKGTVDPLTGSIPDTGMPLEECRAERINMERTIDVIRVSIEKMYFLRNILI